MAAPPECRWSERARHCRAGILSVVMFIPCVASGEESVTHSIRERFASTPAEGPYPETPNFQRHVVTLLGRLGCNGRACHGSFQGRGGFRLSMFGFAFDEDHRALLAGNPLRVNVDSPADSLVLCKPTDADGHEGGKRYDRDGWEYRVLRAWIAGGAKQDSAHAGTLIRLEVTPSELVFSQRGQRLPLRAVAVWSDGTREDVTCLSRFDSHDEFVAEVSSEGIVTCKEVGDTHALVSYDNAVVSIPAMLPHSQIGRVNKEQDWPTRIDEHIAAQLDKLGIIPSPVCNDDEFLRRVCLDVAGTLPSPREVESFARDQDPAKRLKKIDELLASPAYAVWWTTKFCDVMGLNGPLQLGTTDFGPIMTEHWRSWLERKIRDNVAYDRIIEGMVVAVSRQPGQAYEDYAAQMSSYVRNVDPVDYTDRDTMPNFWFRGNLATTEDKALAFAYAFMGVRLDCAQCHKHPFDRWTQQDFQQFAAIFERVRWGVSPDCKEAHSRLRTELGVPEKLNTAATRRQAYWRWAAEGKIVPWPEVFIAPWESDVRDGAAATATAPRELRPKLLGDEEIAADIGDPRQPLMEWLRRPGNPYFARAIVNRIWSHYFGRGIVEPADDLNLANPPSNPRLLDDLSRQFVEQGFDLKWLHREITRSHSYQRSWCSNDTNRTDNRHFSKAAIRRLPAEVALDAMLMATGNSELAEKFRNEMKDRRIGVQATADLSRTEFGLAVFGKPLRLINCDCEREQQPSLSQAIFVRNDPDLNAMLDRPAGWLAQLARPAGAKSTAVSEDRIREAFRRTLSREPSASELARAAQYLDDADNKIDGLRDLLWALINTQEFITNH